MGGKNVLVLGLVEQAPANVKLHLEHNVASDRVDAYVGF